MITITTSVPHRDFLVAMLARHYDPAATPTVLVTTDPHETPAETVDRVILISDHPRPVTLPTLVIGSTPARGASHARLTTGHPAELLSLIDGYLRHAERFPAGSTTAAARI
jgi:hypothetical protein